MASSNLESKVRRRDSMLLTSFYAVVGITQFVIFALTNFRLVTVGALATLSLIASYGFFSVKKWAIWLTIGLFFPQLVFEVVTLCASVLLYSLYFEIWSILLSALFIVFLIASLISFVYIVAKRKTFQTV